MARAWDWGKRKVAKVYDSANRRAQRRKEGMRTEDRSQREAGVARTFLCSPLSVPLCVPAPHRRFSLLNLAISCCISSAIGERPGLLRDFQRQ